MSSVTAGPSPVTYGSRIRLTDPLTGIQSQELIIRKVDKGRITPDDGGPVSQMQKIALQHYDGPSRQYLSAAGPATPGTAPQSASGLSNQAGTHALVFQAPRIREEMKNGELVITDEVDDYLCWTIVGICKCATAVTSQFEPDREPSLTQRNSNIRSSTRSAKIATCQKCR